MTLSLPEDAEPFLTDGMNFSRLRGAGVYCLVLDRPDDLEAAWDQAFDHRPPYFEELRNARQAVYIGAAKDVLARLTDHKDGEKRLTVLTEICDITELRNIWWTDPNRRFVVESQMQTMLQNEKPEWFVHSR